ncbi:hypothetical protein GOODEAATRI_012170 [Goodea atripinnis]|uniref:Vitellogenin n=1 Tax=Goodea atripinnis TaxID=208336 RepID=A0ABV0PXC0_9TELE
MVQCFKGNGLVIESSLLKSDVILLSASFKWGEAGVPGNDWKDLVMEATTEVLKLGSSPLALLFQALLHYVTKMAARETRRLLERLVYVSSDDFPVTVMQVASWYLLRHLHAKNDQELVNVLLQHAKMNGNQRLLEFYTALTSSSS